MPGKSWRQDVHPQGGYKMVCRGKHTIEKCARDTMDTIGWGGEVYASGKKCSKSIFFVDFLAYV